MGGAGQQIPQVPENLLCWGFCPHSDAPDKASRRGPAREEVWGGPPGKVGVCCHVFQAHTCLSPPGLPCQVASADGSGWAKDSHVCFTRRLVDQGLPCGLGRPCVHVRVLPHGPQAAVCCCVSWGGHVSVSGCCCVSQRWSCPYPGVAMWAGGGRFCIWVLLCGPGVTVCPCPGVVWARGDHMSVFGCCCVGRGWLCVCVQVLPCGLRVAVWAGVGVSGCCRVGQG